jgi:hypothetical protein
VHRRVTFALVVMAVVFVEAWAQDVQTGQWTLKRLKRVTVPCRGKQ